MVGGKDSPLAREDFARFVARVAHYKSFSGIPYRIDHESCHIAKFDTSASLHRNAAWHTETGSWIVAAGTVIDRENVTPNGSLCGLLEAYLAQGSSAFVRCDGQFALIVYDGVNRRVIVASDPFGYLSIFYGERGGHTFVSTSALAVAEQVCSPADRLGVNSFLATGKVFGETTLWRDVKRMPGATVVAFDADNHHRAKYWNLGVDETLGKLSLDQAVESSVERVGAVLSRNLAREGTMWSDLTGGFDTRLLTFFLDRLNLRFKADFVGPDEHADVRIAKNIVKTFGWKHEHFQLPADWAETCVNLCDEALGRGDGHLNVLLLLRALWVHQCESRQHTTLLSGLGGEMWRGILWWSERAALGSSPVVHYDRQLWSLMHPIPRTVLAQDFTGQVKSALLEQFTAVGEREPDAPNTVKLDCLWTYRETGHVGAWTSFGAGLLRILPPLFSKDIVQHVISLDYRWKVNNHLVKAILEKYNSRLANIPVEGRGPAVPMRITNFHRFLPSRAARARQAANKFAQVVSGKTLWTDLREEGYSRLARRQSILQFSRARGLFDPQTMHSRAMYDAAGLRMFLEQAQTAGFAHDEFLGRMLTVEMALRAVDTEIEPEPHVPERTIH